MIVAETGETAGAWQMPYILVAPGWNPSGFPSPLEIPRYGLRLAIEWTTETEPAPALSMSGAVALPHGEAYVGTPVAEAVRLPAMRVYRGPAGTTPVEVPYWASAAREGEL